MDIERLKTWHWIVAGLVVGLLFSVVMSWQGPWFDNSSLQTIFQGEFEAKVAGRTTGVQDGNLIREYNGDNPVVKGLVVHPPPTTDVTHQYWVTGKYFTAAQGNKDPKDINSPKVVLGGWVPFKYAAPSPYVPGYASGPVTESEQRFDLLKAKKDRTPAETREMNRLQGKVAQIEASKAAMDGAGSFPTVSEYLAMVQKKHPEAKVRFSTAWWESKPVLWTLPPVAGLLIVGFAGPLAVSALRRAGLSPIPPPLEKKPKKKPVMAGPVRPASPVMASTAGVKIVVPEPPRPMTEREKKEYGGEFYPVVKTTHKDH